MTAQGPRLDPYLAAWLGDPRPWSAERWEALAKGGARDVKHALDPVAHLYALACGVRPHEVASSQEEHPAPGSAAWRRPFDVDRKLAAIHEDFLKGAVAGFKALALDEVASLLFAPEPVLVEGACPSPLSLGFKLEGRAFDRRPTSRLPVESPPPAIPARREFERQVEAAADAIRAHAFTAREREILPTHPEVHRLRAVQRMIDVVHPVLFNNPAPDGLFPIQRGWSGAYRLVRGKGTEAKPSGGLAKVGSSPQAGPTRLVKEAYAGIPSVHTFRLDVSDTLESNNSSSAKLGSALLIPDKEEYLRLGGREHVCDPATREELSIPVLRLSVDADGLLLREVVGHADFEGPLSGTLSGTHAEGRAKTFVALALARRLGMDVERDGKRLSLMRVHPASAP